MLTATLRAKGRAPLPSARRRICTVISRLLSVRAMNFKINIFDLPADQSIRIWIRRSRTEVPSHPIHRPWRYHRHWTLPRYWQSIHDWWSLVRPFGLFDDRYCHFRHDAMSWRNGDVAPTSWCHSAVLCSLCRSRHGFCCWMGEFSRNPRAFVIRIIELIDACNRTTGTRTL